MNVNSWPLTCALGATVLAATALALGDASHGGAARAQGTASVTYNNMTVAGCTFSNICDAELDASYGGITVKAWVQTKCPSCVVNTP
jgi:hypothetical protein